MRQNKTLNMQACAYMLVFLLCFTSSNIVRVVEAIWITLPTSGTKCVMEEMKNNVVVVADYYAIGIIKDGSIHGDAPTISVTVTSPYGDTLHHKENVTHGQFAFTTSVIGTYSACFGLDAEHQFNESVTVALEWKIGIATKDWDSVAKKEKIEGVELEVVKLSGLVEQIQSNLLDLMEREWKMREVSEKTNARVVLFGSASLGVCIVTSVCQLWYLKRFFRKKKLI